MSLIEKNIIQLVRSEVVFLACCGIHKNVEPLVDPAHFCIDNVGESVVC